MTAAPVVHESLARARARTSRRRLPIPSHLSWADLIAVQRYERLLLANAPLGHDLSPISIADALYTLNVQFGVAPPPATDDPPASYVIQVGRSLRAAAEESGDTRGCDALTKALIDYSHGVRPMAAPPQGFQVVSAAGVTGAAGPRTWFVPSASSARLVYRIDPARGCGCKGHRFRNECRHAALIELSTVARERWLAVLSTLATATQRLQAS
jgi:hypothetical protein